MITRHLQAALKTSAVNYPVVTLTGPRQSGKTTLVRTVFSDYKYISLEDPDNRAFAINDPRGFLNQFQNNVILDEVQRTPQIFSYIQGIVDQNDKNGQFILTGSQNFLLMEKITQSLAGRCAILNLLPFSKAELTGQCLLKPEELLQPLSSAEKTDFPDLFEMLFKGFYPRIHDKNLPPQDWLANYYQTYIERDVRQLTNVGDVETFSKFVRLCAGRCGQLLNMASLAADCGLSVMTIKRWLSILQTSFITYLLRPYHENIGKRLIKSPKLYFLDTGLLCYLLGIRSAEQLRTHSSRGAVFESWVLSELLKNQFNHGLAADIHFWRDSLGYEIDFMFPSNKGLILIEAKSGQTFSDDFAKGIVYRKKLITNEVSPAVIVYAGQESFTRENLRVASWRDVF